MHVFLMLLGQLRIHFSWSASYYIGMNDYYMQCSFSQLFRL